MELINKKISLGVPKLPSYMIFHRTACGNILQKLKNNFYLKLKIPLNGQIQIDIRERERKVI